MKTISQKYSSNIYLFIVLSLFLTSFLSYIPDIPKYIYSWISPPICLLLGIIFALCCEEVYSKFNKKASKLLLQYSVVGLGFGMNLHSALESGKDGISFTIISVAGTMILGYLIGYKYLKINKNTSYLISSGTAICGGSAIAAVAPIIDAKENELSVSLGIVFALNALALLIFPSIGEFLSLSQKQFGTWAAIAIHDTSSVVGAGLSYGEEALNTAVTIKLTRALWIIPLAFATSFFFRTKGKKVSVPLFIILFVIAMLINTYALDYYPKIGELKIGEFVNGIARKILSITMFFIGASLSMKNIKSIGIKALLQAVILWIIISITSLIYILLTMS